MFFVYIIYKVMHLSIGHEAGIGVRLLGGVCQVSVFCYAYDVFDVGYKEFILMCSVHSS